MPSRQHTRQHQHNDHALQRVHRASDSRPAWPKSPCSAWCHDQRIHASGATDSLSYTVMTILKMSTAASNSVTWLWRWCRLQAPPMHKADTPQSLTCTTQTSGLRRSYLSSARHDWTLGQWWDKTGQAAMCHVLWIWEVISWVTELLWLLAVAIVGVIRGK